MVTYLLYPGHRNGGEAFGVYIRGVSVVAASSLTRCTKTGGIGLRSSVVKSCEGEGKFESVRWERAGEQPARWCARRAR